MDHLIGVNKEIGAFYKQAGARDARVSVIEPHDFTGGTALQAVPDHITKFTERHDPLLLCVAQLEPEYEVPLQIRTMPRILDEHPRAGLVILGSGTCEADLRELIASSPCADHILLGGDLTHGATLSAIRDSDVLLRTTRYDGDALSVREALHLGTRVLATDNGMRPPGVSLLPSLDEAALSIAVRTVLSGPRPAPVAAEDGNFARVLKLYQRLR
jgi:glycosyltransferase involved in cell wall biosynthesis